MAGREPYHLDQAVIHEPYHLDDEPDFDAERQAAEDEYDEMYPQGESR